MRLFAELVTLAVLLTLATTGASAEGDGILVSFAGTDGAAPDGPLIADASGNLYGTAESGGGSIGCNHHGCGTVFRLAPDGTLTTLHAFAGLRKHDGAIPTGRLTVDESGTLYGTTINGGDRNKHCGLENFRPRGCGTVFKINPGGSEAILYAFSGGDGALPESGVVMHKGNFYGTTYLGGNNFCGYGCGTIFQLAANGNQKVLYAFTGGSDGAYPQSGLTVDKAGNLYGEASNGGGTGCSGYGCGTVYRLATDGTLTVLYAFSGGTDGAAPSGVLIRDNAGNLYGTTLSGGSGWGVVFRLGSDGTETTLYTFKGGSDGAAPTGGLMQDKVGNLFGTTEIGGTDTGCLFDRGCGTVFELSPDGTKTQLHVFDGGTTDGGMPYVGLYDLAGYLYGTTYEGGNGSCSGGCGTVFKLKR
ncbi:MAG TPA: choice-of-anchor tandem repeat GloVer-containing protein [Rhizomicrobium sp.]|jgi:uncharacterized repeat protein (TIGR03803 family)|nr:choice-of-anchor tandem repeat GloVer-containing protein [Rhizomicrobium sp.]